MARRPVLALLLVAPYLGEALSTATSPLELLLEERTSPAETVSYGAVARIS